MLAGRGVPLSGRRATRSRDSWPAFYRRGVQLAGPVAASTPAPGRSAGDLAVQAEAQRDRVAGAGRCGGESLGRCWPRAGQQADGGYTVAEACRSWAIARGPSRKPASGLV